MECYAIPYLMNEKFDEETDFPPLIELTSSNEKEFRTECRAEYEYPICYGFIDNAKYKLKGEVKLWEYKTLKKHRFYVESFQRIS